MRKKMTQKIKLQVRGQEIADLLRQVGRGEVAARLVEPGCSWEQVYVGNVEFDISGYRVVIFNDCDELDYVDSVVTPDDRVGDFEEWYYQGEEPVGLLTEAEQAAIVSKLRMAEALG
jgi:hypothetical protein